MTLAIIHDNTGGEQSAPAEMMLTGIHDQTGNPRSGMTFTTIHGNIGSEQSAQA